jgi:hypothetical protein
MPSAAYGRENTSFARNTNYVSDIARLSAAGDEARLSRDHAIPDRPRSLIVGVAGAQKIAFELILKARVCLTAGPILFTAIPRRIDLARHDCETIL